MQTSNGTFRALSFLYDNLTDFPVWVRRLSPGQLRQLAALLTNFIVGDNPTNTITPLEEISRREITRAVTLCRGDVSAAAKALGIGKTTAYRKLKEWGLSPTNWQLMSKAAALAEKPQFSHSPSHSGEKGLDEL
jgi:hypothetical protein